MSLWTLTTLPTSFGPSTRLLALPLALAKIPPHGKSQMMPPQTKKPLAMQGVKEGGGHGSRTRNPLRGTTSPMWPLTIRLPSKTQQFVTSTFLVYPLLYHSHHSTRQLHAVHHQCSTPASPTETPQYRTRETSCAVLPRGTPNSRTGYRTSPAAVPLSRRLATASPAVAYQNVPRGSTNATCRPPLLYRQSAC